MTNSTRLLLLFTTDGLYCSQLLLLLLPKLNQEPPPLLQLFCRPAAAAAARVLGLLLLRSPYNIQAEKVGYSLVAMGARYLTHTASCRTVDRLLTWLLLLLLGPAAPLPQS